LGAVSHKFNFVFNTRTSPDVITHNQIDHVFTDERRQTSIIDICSLKGDDCDIDHYLVVVTIRERLSLKKGIKQNLVADRNNLNKLLVNETRKNIR
jgi:hypothetical protein